MKRIFERIARLERELSRRHVTGVRVAGWVLDMLPESERPGSPLVPLAGVLDEAPVNVPPASASAESPAQKPTKTRRPPRRSA